MPLEFIGTELSNILFLDEKCAIVTNQQSIEIIFDINRPGISRRAHAHLIDPYALQYVFTFNQVVSFDNYPYPYAFSDYHELLYRNSLYIFYVYACGMDIVENDLYFLPQMDMNSQFLQLENCQSLFYQERGILFVPTLLFGSITTVIMISSLTLFFWKSRVCSYIKTKKNKTKLKENIYGLIKKNVKKDKKELESMTEKSFHKIINNFSDSSAINSISGEISIKEYQYKLNNTKYNSLPSFLEKYNCDIVPLLSPSSGIRNDLVYKKFPFVFEGIYNENDKRNLTYDRHIWRNNDKCIKSATPILSESNFDSEFSSSTNHRVKFNDCNTTLFYDHEEI